ncbi:hypothetical protein BC941DRAFT_416349 [Chlamydoabsidia padenii]|nr:hypothetical protein BC941DRAFT_416349 [Chlamydoabsidia padenii]
MVDNTADLTTSKRKQPEQETCNSNELKKAKTTPSDQVVDDEESKDKSDEKDQTLDDNKLDSAEDEDEEDEDEEGKDDEEEKATDDKNKAESSTKAAGLSDNEDDGISDGELEALDTSLIINTGRRTRGKKIDYTQFGADTPADEE